MCIIGNDTLVEDTDWAEQYLAQHTGQHGDCGECCRYNNRVKALGELGYSERAARQLASTLYGVRLVSGW